MKNAVLPVTQVIISPSFLREHVAVVTRVEQILGWINPIGKDLLAMRMMIVTRGVL
jgi:hypothetical protein